MFTPFVVPVIESRYGYLLSVNRFFQPPGSWQINAHTNFSNAIMHDNNFSQPPGLWQPNATTINLTNAELHENLSQKSTKQSDSKIDLFRTSLPRGNCRKTTKVILKAMNFNSSTKMLCNTFVTRTTINMAE